MELPKELHFSHNGFQIRAILVEGAAWVTGECCMCGHPLRQHTFYTTDPPEFSIHSACAEQALRIVSSQTSLSSNGKDSRGIHLEGSRSIWVDWPPPPSPYPYHYPYPQAYPYHPYHPQSLHMEPYPSCVPNIHVHHYHYYPPPPNNYCAHYPQEPPHQFQQGHGNGPQPSSNAGGSKLGSLAKTALGAFLKALLGVGVAAIIL